MPTFRSNGCDINYIDEGEGPPIVLVHGFASSLEGNWRATGVIDALIKSGRRVVALDCRGHGKSEKPHDPAEYADGAMPRDVIALMDHLSIDRADLMGYSMGGFIATALLVQYPERFGAAVIGGAGERVVAGDIDVKMATQVADALEAPDDSNASPVGKMFRMFAKQTGGDLKALAAIMRGGRPRVEAPRLGDIKSPVLVLAGTSDPLVGKVERLAEAIPGAKLATIPGDHISVFAGPAYRDSVLAFFAEQSPVAAG